MECSLLECRKPVNADTGRVEVRAYQVSSSQRAALKVGWNENGEAVFHHACWNRLVKATKKKETQTEADTLQVSELEASLILEAKKHAEFHDSDGKVKAEAARIAQMIKNANYCIGFTGAGISTAAGIGDFRGKDGKWTEKDKKKDYGSKGLKKGASRGYSIVDLRPTYTHESIVKLIEMGHMKYLISQNTDGLHRLSGVPEDKISELHGKSFVEKCEKCGARYMRPKSYRSYGQSSSVPAKPCERCHINHRTGRICEKKECGGYLMNTIINFGDNLEPPVLGSAKNNAKRADLVLCLGSTLTVSPANSLVEMGIQPGCGGYLMNTIINFGDYLEGPVLDSAEKNAQNADLVLCLGSTLRVSPANALVEMGKQPIRLVICNRQGTPYDDYCCGVDEKGAQLGSRVFGDCDKLMKEVMLALFGGDLVQEWEDGRETRMKTYDKRRS